MKDNKGRVDQSLTFILNIHPACSYKKGLCIKKRALLIISCNIKAKIRKQLQQFYVKIVTILKRSIEKLNYFKNSNTLYTLITHKLTFLDLYLYKL